jgi:hypothetical protein
MGGNNFREVEMRLMWFEMKFNEIDLSRGKAEMLKDEIKKLYTILDHLEGIALYAGKYKKSIGQRYFLTIPDNHIGRNLLQYLKLKNYIPCNEPDRNEITYECGSPLSKVTKAKTDSEPVSSLMYLN